MQGSILVAGAHFEGFVMGADIDYPLLHGKGTHVYMHMYIVYTLYMYACMYWYVHVQCI